MRRTQIYLTDEQGDLLERHSRASGRSVSELIRDAIDGAFARRRAPTRAERVRIAERTAGAWQDRETSGREYVERLRGSGRLARLHRDA